MPTDPGYRNTTTTGKKVLKPRTTPASTASRTSGKTSWQRIGGAPLPYDAEFRADLGYGTPNYVPGSYNETAYRGYAHAMALGGLPQIGPANPIGPGSPGGGSGGYGGGGGGGSGMTQAMYDLMAQMLGRAGPQLQAQQLNLPAFQGQNIAAFNPASYDQAQQSLGQAVAADTANVNANAQNTTNTLNQNYRNDYANAQVIPGATQAPVGTSLQATAGAPMGGVDPNQQAAAGVNAGNADSQAAFANLLQVLAANANQSQASRLNQVQMDRGTAQNAIGAQNLGLGAGINMARTNAQTQWQQQDAERRYQNSLMAQQWQREQEMANNQSANQVGQLNWQQQNAQRQATLQPILDLIASGQGLNTSALQALLAR